MDPLTVGLIILGAYLLLRKSSSTPAPAAGTSTATGTNSLASALQQLLGSSSTSKPSAGSSGGGLAGGGGAAPGGSAGNAGSSAALGGTYTSESTIDQLATDGSASDAQVAAYLQALDQGNTDTANAIIGNDAPVDLQSDPTAYAGVIAPVDSSTYDLPTMDYTPPADDPTSYDGGDDGGSYDSGD